MLRIRQQRHEIEDVQLDRCHENDPFVIIECRETPRPHWRRQNFQLAVHQLYGLSGEGHFDGLILFPCQHVCKELHGLLGQGDRLSGKNKAGSLRFSLSVFSSHDVALVPCTSHAYVWESMCCRMNHYSVSCPSGYASNLHPLRPP